MIRRTAGAMLLLATFGCREAPKSGAVGETTATIRALPEPDSVAVRAAAKPDSHAVAGKAAQSKSTKRVDTLLRDSVSGPRFTIDSLGRIKPIKKP